MELSELIYRRKSNRSYTAEPVADALLGQIRTFAAQAKPLYPGIRVRVEIIGREVVKGFLPFRSPQLLAIYSEEKEGYLENVGFLFQQMDLYLQSLGLGSCWLGMGRLRQQDRTRDGLRFVIMMAFGYPKGPHLRSGPEAYKRRSPAEISDQPDDRLEPARLAPSSVNSQPWYFTHDGDVIHVSCGRPGVFKARSLSKMNQIDIGIALAHLYVAHPEGFRFFRSEEPPLPDKGYNYMGSITL